LPEAEKLTRLGFELLFQMKYGLFLESFLVLVRRGVCLEMRTQEDMIDQEIMHGHSA
jgi:hypothetical protein